MENLLSLYPTALIDAFDGGENFLKIQVLELGNRRGATGYIDFIRPKDFNDTPGFRRGICNGVPFFTMCMRQVIDSSRPELEIVTIFPRGDNWMCCAYNYIYWTVDSDGEEVCETTGPIHKECVCNRRDLYWDASEKDYFDWYPFHYTVHMGFFRLVKEMREQNLTFGKETFLPPFAEQ